MNTNYLLCSVLLIDFFQSEQKKIVLRSLLINEATLMPINGLYLDTIFEYLFKLFTTYVVSFVYPPCFVNRIHLTMYEIRAPT